MTRRPGIASPPRRSTVARTLADPKYRQRVVRSKKRYTRKGRAARRERPDAFICQAWALP